MGYERLLSGTLPTGRFWPTAADLSTSTGLSDHVAGLSVQQRWNAQEV